MIWRDKKEKKEKIINCCCCCCFRILFRLNDEAGINQRGGVTIDKENGIFFFVCFFSFLYNGHKKVNSRYYITTHKKEIENG